MMLDDGVERAETKRVNRKIAWRLLPLLCLLMFVSYFDRISLSYAGPAGMNEDLGLTATTFGFAAGIFFFGYILLEVPSNLALRRFGARTWLARIIVSWGIVQVLTAFAPNDISLYILRFLLGVAEAGFAPGVIFYLTLWFSQEFRGRAITRFLFSVTIASVLGAPISNFLIGVGDASTPFGLTGWRFLILAVGVPAIILGVITWFYLDKGPAEAKWLTAAEKADIERRIMSDTSTHSLGDMGVGKIFRSGRIWLLGLCYFSFIYGTYALTFFLPTLVVGFQARFDVEYSPLQISLITAVPFLCGGVAQLLFGRLVDRRGHAGFHIAVAAVIGLIGGVAASFATDPLVLILCLSLMAFGITGGGSTTLVLVAKLHTGASAATSIALVNTIGITAGFFGPYFTGWLQDLTGNPNAGFVLISVLLVASALIAFTIDLRLTRRRDLDLSGVPLEVAPASGKRVGR